MSLRKKEYID